MIDTTATLPLVEKFISIDGEGPNSGTPTLFIRLFGCNMRCPWCDTKYSYGEDATFSREPIKDVVAWAISQPTRHVTLTGGEPLIHTAAAVLIQALVREGFTVSVETNGSIQVEKFRGNLQHQVYFIIDTKLSSARSEACPLKQYAVVQTQTHPRDVYKFVIASDTDLEETFDILLNPDNELHTNYYGREVYLSPAFGCNMDQKIVQAVIDNSELFHKIHLTRLHVQLQIHKYIWDPEQKGV